MQTGRSEIAERDRGHPIETSLAGQARLARITGRLQSPLVLALVVFLMALGPRLLDLRVFVGPDEFLWLERTADFAQAVTQGDWARTYQTGHPGVMVMWAETVGAWVRYGVRSLQGPADWIAITGPDQTMETLAIKRQVIGVSNAILVALVALLVYRVFGSGVAWLAGILLAFDPFFLAESRVLRPEGTVTAFSALGLLALVLYLKEPRFRYSLLAGALAGLALLSKVSAAVLLPVGLLVIAGGPWLERFRPPGERRRIALVMLLAWGGALLLAVFILWPALWLDPVGVFQKTVAYSAERTVEGESSGGDAFFLGTTRPHAELGPLFYLLMILFRTTPLVWLGLVLLLVTLWPASPLAGWRKAALGVMLAYLLLYLALITNSTLKFGRYIIPVLPVLSLMAALGLASAWQTLTRRFPRLAGWGWLPVLLALAGQVAVTLPHHPYYYTYWNPLLGGPQEAVKVLPVGSGEGIEEVVNYLNSLPDADQLKLASGSAQQIGPVLKGQQLPLTNWRGEWFVADYTFLYISQMQRHKYDPNILAYLRRSPPVYTVTLEGLDYGWLYRGPGAQYYGGDTTLEGRATLHAYDLSDTSLAAGQTLTVTVYFRNEGQRPTDRFYVRLVDGAGYVWTDGTVRPRPGFEDAFGQREAIVEGEVALPLPVGMPPGEYLLKMGYEDTALDEFVGEFHLPGAADRVRVQAAPAGSVVVGIPHPVGTMVGPELKLLGYGLNEGQVVPGEGVWLSLYWQAMAPISTDYVLGLQLVDQAGQETAYWLGRPWHGGYATTGWPAGQVVQDPWWLAVPGEARLGRYQLRLTAYDAGRPVQTITLDQVEVVKRRQEFEVPTLGHKLGAVLGEKVELLGYDLVAEPLLGGGRLRVVLYWRGRGAMDRSYTAFVQLLNSAGVLVAQHDGLPGEGQVPTNEWAVGEVVADRHLVEFRGLPAGEYRLIAGMYDGQTGERLAGRNGEIAFDLETVRVEGP